MTPTGTQLARGLDVTVARSAEDVEALRPAWVTLQAEQLTADLDYFLTVTRADPHVVRPHVVLVERDGEPVGLAAARVRQTRLRCRVGYRRLYEPPVRTLTVVYGGLLGPLADSDPGLLLDALSSGLERREVDAVQLIGVGVDGPLATRLAAESAPWRRNTSEPRRHWRVGLPGSYDDFLAARSSSTRQGLRRQAAKLEREHPELRLLHISTVDQLDAFFAAAGAVADTTYQRNLGVGIREDDELQRALVMLGMQRGWFRGLILFLDDAPAAFWHGYGYHGVFQTGVPGYAPRYARSNVGTVVLLKLVEELCADPAISTLDFGFGDAEYKRRLGDHSWLEQDVLVFARSFRALRINTIRSSLLSGVALGKRVAAVGGSPDRIKKLWRRRISAGGSSGAQA